MPQFFSSVTGLLWRLKWDDICTAIRRVPLNVLNSQSMWTNGSWCKTTSHLASFKITEEENSNEH